MPLPWTVAIIVVVAVALVLRIALPQLPLRAASPTSVGRIAALGLGLLGLVAHCAAMFFTDLATSVPGSGGYLGGVNGMGRTSLVLYAVPALLVVAGLSRVSRSALAVVVVLLLVVGVTMYDGGPLTVHLTSILLVVIAIAATVAALVGGRPGVRDPGSGGYQSLMSNETPPPATTETSETTETTTTAAETEPEMLGASEPTDDPALEKDPADWVSGGDPITEAQKSYLDTLARQAGEELPADLTKAEASQHIDRLRGKNDLG